VALHDCDAAYIHEFMDKETKSHTGDDFEAACWISLGLRWRQVVTTINVGTALATSGYYDKCCALGRADL
jgi:hypothetical protein